MPDINGFKSEDALPVQPNGATESVVVSDALGQASDAETRDILPFADTQAIQENAKTSAMELMMELQAAIDAEGAAA